MIGGGSCAAERRDLPPFAAVLHQEQDREDAAAQREAATTR